MELKKLAFIALLGLVFIAVLSFAQAAPPSDAPGSILDRIADFQNEIAELWGNATAQQQEIQSEAGTRTGGDQLLWTNASEQQLAIQTETDARLSGDQALLTNATDQQSAIEAESAAREAADTNLQSQIDGLEPGEPGTTVHFGEWDEIAPGGGPYLANTVYTADTDGFVCAYVFIPDSDILPPYEPFIIVSGYSTAFNIAEVLIHPGDSDSVMYPVRAGANWRLDIFGPGYEDAVYKIRWLPLTT